MFDYYDSEIELLGDVGVLTLAGETDLYTAHLFRRDLDEAMEADEPSARVTRKGVDGHDHRIDRSGRWQPVGGVKI